LGSVLQQADAGPVPVPLFLLVSIALRANYHLDDLPDREDPDKSKRISARNLDRDYVQRLEMCASTESRGAVAMDPGVLNGSCLAAAGKQPRMANR
jgi:hypothetical protein